MRTLQKDLPGGTDEPRGQTAWVVTITPRSVWVMGGTLALMVCIAFVIAKALFPLILLFIAIIFAEGLRPVVDWLEERRVARPLGVLLIYAALLGIVLIFTWILVRPVIRQANGLSRSLPEYVAQAQSAVSDLQHRAANNPQLIQIINSLKSSAGAVVNGLLPLLLQIPMLIMAIIFSSIVVAVMAFFWLTGVERLKPFVIGLFPPPARSEAADILSEIGKRMGGYVRGVAVNMVAIGVLSGGADWVLGVPYPTLLGIFAGMCELIPYFGPWISGGIAVLVALISVGPLKAVEVVGVYLLIQEVEGHTLIPYVMMRAVKLNPLVVVISVLIGTELLGIIGGVLAVPAAAILDVLVVRGPHLPPAGHPGA